MSKSKKIVLLGALGIAILGVIGYFYIPSALTNYANGMMPGVHVQSARLKSLNCVTLTGISIDRDNIKGNITSAIACKSPKTIVADGGSITLTLKSGLSNPSNDTGMDKYRIIGTNLSLKVQKDDAVLQLEKAGIDGPVVFAPSGTATLPYGTVNVENININRTSREVTVERARTLKDGIGEVLVSNLHASSTEIYANEVSIKRDKDSYVGATDVTLSILQHGFVEIKAKKAFAFHPMLYSERLSVEDVVIAPFPLSEYKTTDHVVGIRGVTFQFNLEKKNVSGHASCQEWLRALPQELKTPPIEQVKFKGDMNFSLELLPDVKFRLRNGCVVDGGAPDFIKALSGTFKYTAYHPNSNGKFERVSGPGSPDWVPLDSVSDTMVKALTTTEDPGFFGHRGVIPQAIENSIKDNLKLGKFFRGGSTITMQLAKNLWLTRKRTLGRKIQEAVLTAVLESTLPKEKILELYLNIVEFGPDIYGIGPGSEKLLGTHPINISLSQALYLVLRLPAPSRAGTYEQMKGKIGKMLDLMASNGKLSAEEAGYEKAFLFEDFNEEQ